MQAHIKEQIHSLHQLFEKNLRSSIQEIIQNSNAYGYALHLGEDIDNSIATAVANSEADFDPLEEDHFYNKYCPDEWNHWYEDHFKKFNDQLDLIYQKFEKTHQVTNENHLYTNDALEYLEALYEVYLQGIKSVQNEFPSISYWVIWIPDSYRDINKKSILELNDEKVKQEAIKIFS